MKPTLGRIVIYQEGGVEFAAMVVHIWTDVTVNLMIFNNGMPNGLENVNLRTSVSQGEGAYHWKWPERV